MSNGLSQTQSGKGFEYAMACAMHIQVPSSVLLNNADYLLAQECYLMHPPALRTRLDTAAHKACAHLLQLEPRLVYGMSTGDFVTITLQPDSAGQAGDVRDIIMLRSALSNWEIGISCKKNHADLKHSRLSPTIDIGKEWMNVASTPQYWSNIAPIFAQLTPYIANKQLWQAVLQKDTLVYAPLLQAFCAELLALATAHPQAPHDMADYILGRHDFYKVMCYSKQVKIQAFNMHGTLGKSYKGKRSTHPVAHIKLPTHFTSVAPDPLKPYTHVLTALNHGWTFDFRLHNGDKKVMKSLKFAVSLVGHPPQMHSHSIAY